jgi:hypothetical protein
MAASVEIASANKWIVVGFGVTSPCILGLTNQPLPIFGLAHQHQLLGWCYGPALILRLKTNQ